MKTAVKTDSLKATDLMERHVVAISPRDTLHDALDLLVDNHLTGLPVIDSADQCIGILSMSDILGFEQETGRSAAEETPMSDRYFNNEQQRWEAVGFASFALDNAGDTVVEDVMTRDVISVSPDTPIPVVAGTMLEHEVHRILVVDADRRLHGIISSFDFVKLSAE